MDTESELSIKGKMLLDLIDSSYNGGRLDTKAGCVVCVIPFVISLGPFLPEQNHILVFTNDLFYLHLNR